MKIFITLSLLWLSFAVHAQQRFKVFNNVDSLAIANATIMINGQPIQFTDQAGGFVLQLPNGSYDLQIKFLGFETLIRTIILPSTDLAFYLKPLTNTLQEVQINTGYQILPKERATGSFVNISKELLNEQMTSDVLGRLAAVANSVTVDYRSSSKGNLMVRGLSSISAPREPLIILDNFPYSGDINNINPNDIENITILKDAAATSIWGTRAGNGVIVITSKKGKMGKPLTIEINSHVNLLAKPNLFQLNQMSSQDYLGLEQLLFDKGFYDSKINSIAKPFLSPMVELLAAKRNGTINETTFNQELDYLKEGDVRKEFAELNYSNGVQQQYALGITSSQTKIDWKFTAGYDQQVSALAALNNRLNLNSSNTLRLSKKLSVDLAILYTQTLSKEAKADYQDLSTQGFLYPYLRLRNENGLENGIPRTYSLSYLNSLDRNLYSDWNYYPLSDYLNNEIKVNSNDLLFNLGVNYQVLPNLQAKLYFQNQRSMSANRRLYGEDSYFVRSTINAYTQIDNAGKAVKIIPMGQILDREDYLGKSYNLRGQLNYFKSWDKHTLSILGGYEFNEKNSNGTSNRTYGYNDVRLSNALINYNILYPNAITKATSFIQNNDGFSSKLFRFVSTYANMGYTFLQKYTLSASARKDASNLFGLSANDKWKPLWSVGAAWQIDREHFMQKDWLNELKLRTSFGYSGNVDLSRSALTTIIGGITSPFTNNIMSRFNQFSNPDLRWEKVGTLNVGLDFGLWQNRVNGSVEFYHKKATDLYGNSPVDYTAIPTPAIIKNVASIKANGLDFAIQTKNTIGVVKWNTTLNLNLYKDKVLAYQKVSDLGASYVGTGIIASPLIGYPVYSVFSYRWGGLEPNTGNPIGYVNGVPSTDYALILGEGTKIKDLVYNGPAFPTVFGNIGNTVNYKGWGLSARITYKLGYYFGRNSVNYNNLFRNGVMHADYAKRWQQPGDELKTNVPSLVYPAISRRDNFYNNAEVLVEKADHVRLAYVALSYQLQQKWLTRSPFSSFQLQANVNNLGILWRANRLNIDPDYRENVLIPSQFYSFGIRCALKN